MTFLSAPRERELVPYQATRRLDATSVLVVAPHPDDEVFGCGGAVAQHVHDGVPVRVIVLTDGAQAGDPATRKEESAAAAKTLGYPCPHFWQQPDRGLRCTPELVERMRAFMQEQHIDLVYAPAPSELHPDHRQAAELVLLAAQALARPIHVALYELSAPLQPNVLLDISPWVGHKHVAMECFPSQNAHQPYPQRVAALNRYRAYTLGPEVEAAEAYCLMDAAMVSRWVRDGVGPGADAPAAPGMPLVSILIRSTDRAELTEALDSVALQTYPNIEIVVIAAVPGHRTLPARCGPHALRLIPTDAARARSVAANVGLQEARGEWVLFLDDDDWLMPGHIARLAEVLRGQPHAQAAYTGVSLVDATGRPMGQAMDMPFDAVRQLAGNMTPIHAVLFRKPAGDLRFDETLDRYEDWDFWMRLARRAPMVHLPGVSAAYRIHTSSGVHSDSGPMGAATQTIYQNWRAHWTPQELGALMSRVWSHPELEVRLNQSDAFVHALQARLAEQAAEIGRQSTTLADQAVALQQSVAHGTHLQIQWDSARAEAHAARAEVHALRHSLSWRITAGLRAVAGWLRKLRA